MIFLYHASEGVRITETTPREHRRTYPRDEFLMQFHTIQDARRYCERMTYTIIEDIKKSWTGHTPAGLERIREAKRGRKNPNAKGLSETHKRKIGVTMQARRGEHHHFYNMHHSPRSKMKISLGLRRKPPRKWCLDPEGREHLVYLPFVLPASWCWGRKRGSIRLRTS